MTSRESIYVNYKNEQYELYYDDKRIVLCPLSAKTQFIKTQTDLDLDTLDELFQELVQQFHLEQIGTSWFATSKHTEDNTIEYVPDQMQGGNLGKPRYYSWNLGMRDRSLIDGALMIDIPQHLALMMWCGPDQRKPGRVIKVRT